MEINELLYSLMIEDVRLLIFTILFALPCGKRLSDGI